MDPEWATANWTYENGNIDQGTNFDVICNSEARTKWYVSTSGSDLNGNGTSQSPLSSIQTALNAATEGDTVYVAAGTYYEHIVFNGSKNVELVGEDSSNTIIDAQQQNVVMRYFSSPNIRNYHQKFYINEWYYTRRSNRT